MKTSSLLVSGLLFSAVAGCGGGAGSDHTVVVHEPAPICEPAPPPEPAEEVVIVEGEGEPGEGGLGGPAVDVAEGPVVRVEVEHEYVVRGPRLRGPAVENFNTGYLDGWAGAEYFNRGQALTDPQVERMLDVGRRQGDPTGKLARVGYEDGYRAGARHEPNPYERRMSPEQTARLRGIRGQAPEAEVVVVEPARRPHGPGPGSRSDTVLRVDGAETRHGQGVETEAARRARLEASQNNLQASRNNLEAEQKRLRAEQTKLELARAEQEKARHAEAEAAKAKRDAERDQREATRAQREVAQKAKAEAEHKQREADRQQRELALKNKLEAERAQREAARKQQELARREKDAARDAEQDADKQQREAKRDERQAARDKREAERKQRLAEKKLEREAKKTETAGTAEPAH